jgi:hypothetical protein
MRDDLIDTLTGSYVSEARKAVASRDRFTFEAMADQVAGAETKAIATLRHVVRSMHDIFKFKALQRGEASWRSEVYAGESPYRTADDAIRVAGYQRWAASAREIIADAAAR